MGKPKCTQEAIATAIELKKAGANNKDIALAIGVSESMFCRWINTPKSEAQIQLGQELKKAEADYKAELLRTIKKASKERDWKAAAWLLERKYPEEYSRREKVILDNKVKDEDSVPRFFFDRKEASR